MGGGIYVSPQIVSSNAKTSLKKLKYQTNGLVLINKELNE